MKFAPAALTASLLALAGCDAAPAYAYSVYDATCAQPASPAHSWYIDPVNGSTPDAAHGGVAVNGVVGTADGSAAHPFNSIQGVFTGGKIHTVAGYGWPLLSTAPWDHYGVTYRGVASKGVNGNRVDDDWAPTNPDPDRINPGDAIVLENGSYGDVGIGYSGVATNNIDANGNTDFVTIAADAGATPMFRTFAISGSRGFVVQGVTTKTDKSAGSYTSGHIGTVSGSSDIIISGDTFESWANFDEATAAWNAEDPTHATSATLAAFLHNVMRWGFMVNTSTCVAVENNHLLMTYSAFVNSGDNKLLFANNELDHFANDGVDISSSNATFRQNYLHDSLNIGDGAHTDSHQTQVSGTYPGPFTNVVIDGDVTLERVDPTNPFPGQSTFMETTGPIVGGRIVNNVTLTSNCPGLAFSGSGTLIANNDFLGNGVPPGAGCPAPQSGEVGSATTHNNTWENNVASRFYQSCDGSVWSDNVQIPNRGGGVSTPDALSYCDPTTNTVKITSKDGVYNGVTVITTDSPTFAFTHYDPPAGGLVTAADPNLVPTVGGPLYQTGTPVTMPNIGAM